MRANLGGIGVIFDVDGVLVDSFEPHRRSWRMLATELGRTGTHEQFAATFGQTSRDIIRALFPDCASDDAEIRRLDDRKEAIYRDLIRGRVPLMAGAIDCVRALHAAGARLAVGSSGPPENVRMVVDAVGADWFAAIVHGFDISRGKPDPEVFLLASERLGIRPDHCVVIEDAPVGIEAARRAGMRTVGLVGSHAAADLHRADRFIAGLGELTPEIVANLFRKNG